MTVTAYTELLTGFDYASLDSETRIVVQQKTGEIKDRIKRTAQDLIEIGDRLNEVKGRLGHGAFGTWLKAEFDWSDDTALNLMRVATKFRNFRDLAIAPSALYALSAPSVPPAAREEVIEKASNGHRVTHAEAKEVIAKHKGSTAGPVAEPVVYPPEQDATEQAEVEASQPETDEPEPPPAKLHEPTLTLTPPPASDSDPAAAAGRWMAQLEKVTNDINILLTSIERRGGFVKLVRRWPKPSVVAAIDHLKELAEVSGQSVHQLEKFIR